MLPKKLHGVASLEKVQWRKAFRPKLLHNKRLSCTSISSEHITVQSYDPRKADEANGVQAGNGLKLWFIVLALWSRRRMNIPYLGILSQRKYPRSVARNGEGHEQAPTWKKEPIYLYSDQVSFFKIAVTCAVSHLVLHWSCRPVVVQQGGD